MYVWVGGNGESRPAWTAAGFPRGSSVRLAPEMLFWAARIIKASSDSPLSFFHYLLTFCAARQPCSITAFDFECSLLTGMKNAYLAELRRNVCVFMCAITVCQRERDGEKVALKMFVFFSVAEMQPSVLLQYKMLGYDIR